MTFICKSTDIEEGGCLEFEWGGHPCFLVRRNGRVFGYRNYCPHRGVTLNWSPDDFLTESGDELRCATHDARFRVEDGMCIAGPCKGEVLVPVPVVVIDGFCCIASKGAGISA